MTGDAFADVVLGKSYPSGKLSTTWTAWKDYCNVGDFGNQDDTRYREEIYVGYRYFDSLAKKVLFPFGYGLGYTSFFIDNEMVKLEGTTVCVNARVRNIGTMTGKEVVQVYVSVRAGRLDYEITVST